MATILMVTILMIYLKRNLPNSLQLKQYSGEIFSTIKGFEEGAKPSNLSRKLRLRVRGKDVRDGDFQGEGKCPGGNIRDGGMSYILWRPRHNGVVVECHLLTKTDAWLGRTR